MGDLVAAELAAKLDRPGLRLDFGALMASDLAGKARAIKGLVEAGVDLTQAMMIAGFSDAVELAIPSDWQFGRLYSVLLT